MSIGSGKTQVHLLAVIVGCACAVAGCVSTPLPDLQVAVPPQWQQGVAPKSTVAAPIPAPWWRAFDDPRLDAAVDEALAANLDIGQATARLRAARALNRTADAPLRPDLHLRTTNPIDPDASASYLVVGFDSLWELGLFGRGTGMHRIARGDLDSAKAELGEVRISVAAEVARQWILLRTAQQRESLLATMRGLRVEQAGLMQERLHLQLASPQQLAQSRAAAAQAEAALAEPREAATTAAQALAVLTARSEPDPDWLRAGAMPALQDVSVTSAPADLMRQRPDVLRAQAAVLTAAGELGVAKADMYPSITIGGSIVQSTSEAERLSTDTGRVGSIGPLVDIPLFDWGMRRARAQAKGESLRAAALAYRKSVLTAVGEVEAALAALEQQRLREQAGVQALGDLEQVAAIVARRQQLGLASALDTGASNLERDEAALELAAARSSRALDYIALCKALGGAPGVSALATAGERR